MRGRNFFDDYEEFNKPAAPEVNKTPTEAVKEADEVKPTDITTTEVKEAETPAENTSNETMKGGEENGIPENE